MQKAYNPQTGEVIFLVDNQWVKPNQTARNPKTGQMAYLVNNSWQIVDPMTSPEEVVTSPEESLTPVTPTEAQTRLEALTKQYEAEVPFTQRITDPLKRGAIQLGGVIPGIDVTNRQKEIDRIRSGDAGRTDPITGEFIPLAPEEAEAAIRLLQQDQAKSQRQIMETQARAGEIRQRPAVEAIGKAKTMREALEAFGADPIGAAASVSLESVTQMAPALILAAVTRNPTLGAAALGGSSYALELSSGVYEYFQENGVNLSDQEAVKNALNDPKMFQAAVDFAQTRAGIIGTADLASAGLASRLLVPKKLITSPGGREIANIAVAQPLSQIASGAGGEAAAQLATYGEVKKPGQALLEAIGGGPSSVLETAVFGGKRIYDQLKSPVTPETPTTAPVETRVEPTLGEIPPEITPQKEPPVQPGFVRVYHSGEKGDGEFGRFVSTNREYASKYRKDLPLFYTDLPADDPRVNNPDYADQGVAQGFTFNFELTPQEATNLKEISRPQVSPTFKTTPAPQETLPKTPEDVETIFSDEDLAEEQKPTAKPEAPVKAEEPPPVQNLTGELPIQEIPIKDLKISEEVPQFKIGATKEGVVEPLGGKFERTGVAPIQVWKRIDGSLEVISGRHRFDLAKRSKEQTIPAQIHDEAQGFTKNKASILDAELNIRDGQGKVKDYVGYFKGTKISKDQADARGLLARPIGKRSYTIANSGSEELITAHRADAVGDEAAYLISINAPGDASLQAVGIKAIQEGKSISSAVNLMQAVKTLAGERQTTTDMFGFDESAMKEAEEMAKIAARKQREIQQRLSVMTGASKNPELAEKEGINVKDPVAVRRRVDELRQAKAAFDNWSSNSELIGQIRAEMKPSEFVLRPQTEEDLRAQEAAAAEREAAELKAIADREVGLFGLQPQVQEREAPPSGDLFGAQGLGQQPGKKAPPAPPIETGLFAQKDQATINRERQAEQREKAAEKEKPTKGDVLLIEVNEKDFAKALDVSKIKDPRLEELFDTKQKPSKPQPEQFLSPKEAKKIIDGWKKEANKQGQSGDNANKTVISLFDASGEWSKPWADAGFNVVTYDLQTGQDIKDFDAASLLEEHGNDNVWAILAAPPCTDFASSGAQYWKSKDADGRTELSNELVRQVLRTVELLRPAVWAMENPVGRMAKLNELPPAQLTFQPNLYGNPYTKKTLLWGNFNNQLPQAPVEPTDGSKIIKISGNNKYERSLTPEGFAYSFFAANNPINMTQENRLSREFHGIKPDEFKGAGTEEEIRNLIQDDYYDGDLTKVREILANQKSTADKILSRKDVPNNMEIRVFKTTDGYGASLYDKDSEQVVSGSVTRYKGADAQVKAEAYAKQLEDEATPKKAKQPKLTKEQIENAQTHADETGGEVVFQKGDYALIRGYSMLTGDPVYVPTIKTSRAKVDIERFSGNQVPEDVRKEMIEFKKQAEKEAANKHKDKSFITFDRGLALSEDISPELAGVIRGWKDLLKLDVPIYVSTIEDAKKNRNNFTGPHRRIGSGTLDSRERGSIRRMADDSYYILFEKSSSPTLMLEVIGHEMGHLHERLFYEKAPEAERKAVRAAFDNWLASQKGKSAQDLVSALRGRATARKVMVPAGQMADDMNSYWRSFGEWYADQVSRWAVSAKAPVNVVEKFFKRLANQLRQFYQKLKNAKYLPDETFVKYLENTNKEPVNLSPPTDQVERMIEQEGFAFDEEDTEGMVSSRATIAKPGIDQPQTKKLPKGRSPELVAAAQDLADGKITKDEYEQAVKKYKPIYPYEEPPKPATYDQVYDALDSNKRSKVNPEIKAGTPVGLRLDIPSFNRKGIFTVSIHEKRTPSAAGDVIGYGSVGRIKNVTFGLGKQTKALDIAKGASKDVIQTMEGTWVPSTEAEIVAEVNKNFNNPEWTQVGINPERHSYFWDRFTTVPVISADEVIQIGNFILAKNPVYGTKEDFLFNISSQPQLTQTDRFFSRITYRQEMIDELRALKVRKAKVIKDITNYGSDIATQRLLNELNEQIESIKLEITPRPVKSAENFINQARNAMDGKGVFRVPSLEPEVFAVIKQLYLKYPFLLEGLQLSIRTKKISPYPSPEGEVLGSFNGARRIVTLWNGTDGVSNPETVRHEVMHSLEQMMNGPQKQAILDSYFKALRKAIQKNTDPASQKFFENVIKFLNNPSESLRTKAIDTMPSLDFYQYVNPSEYWAVNAEKLMAANLGTAWAQFKKLVSKLFEALKDFFGFDNRFAVHQVFDNILKNKPHRMSYMSLVDMEVLPPRDMLPMTDKQVQDFLDDRFKDEPKFAPTFLANVKKEQDLIDKHKRPKTPMLNTNEVKTFIVDGFRLGKEIFQDVVKNPGSAVDTLFNPLNRGLLYLRNQGVFFGAGLEEADRLKNEGMMRDTNDIISASVALDNALHGPMISAEVITRGGITYDNKLEVYRAENLKTNMINVYKAQAELKEKLGAQLGEDIIQSYLEAKRSRSILEEEKARNEEVGKLRQQLSVMSESDPDYDKILNLLGQAAGDLINIQNVVQKINMSDEAINEFIDLEKVHPELRTIIENYNGTNQNLLEFHRRVGLLSKERYLRLSQIKDYVPWQRIMDDEADIHSPVQSTTRKMVNIGKEKLFKKGKPKNVIDFVAEDGQTEFKIQPSSVVGISVNDVKLPPSSYTVNSSGEIKLSKPLNSGDVVLVQSVKEIENIIDNMTRNIMRMTMNGLRQAAAVRIVQQYASRDAKGKIIVFPRVDPKKGHLDFIANGRRIVVEIKDPLIATSMLGMESIGIKTVSVLAQAANFTRRAITVDPFFQIAQLVKDAPTAAFISGVKNPFALVSSVLTGFASSLNEKDPVVQLLRSAGIGGFQSAARTPEAKIKRQIGIINKSTYDAIIEVLDKIGDASDMAQRRAVYIRVLKETGDEARALYQASTIAPFHRHGASGIAQFFVKTVPFMNAYAVNMDIQINALQGKNLKGMKRNAALGYLIGTGIAFSSISLFYAFAAGLDDDYWELDDQTKLRNIYVPFSKSLTGKPILIPMNTGPAFLFKALPEMLFLKVISEGTDNEIDRARLKRALGTAALDSLLGPSPIPSVIKPIVEINLNRNFFTGRELVPRGMENLEEYRKYSASTSELGKVLGSITDYLNPIEADHLIRSLFGTAGALSMWASNLALGASTRPEMTLKDVPGAGRFIGPQYPRGKEDLFYDLLERTKTKHNTFEDKIKTMDVDEAIKYAEKNAGLIALHNYMTQLESDLKEINRDINQMGRGSKELGLDPKERREMIDNLQNLKRSQLTGIERLRNLAEEIKLGE